MTDDALLTIEGWARDGLSDAQIAHNIGVTDRSFSDWKSKFSSISSALKKGRKPVDIEVENALLKSALGYYITIKEPIKVRTEQQKPGVGKLVQESIEYVDKQVYVPPQTAAQIFWLKNRKTEQWRDRPEPPMSSDALERLDEVLSNIKGVV